MGIIADRIALKTQPFYGLAKDIARYAVDNSLSDESADYPLLFEAVELALATTSPSELPALLSSISHILAVRTDAEDVMQFVRATFDTVCTTGDIGLDSVGHLVALPLVFLAKTVSWEIQDIASNSERIAAVMRDYELIEDDATISVLPRILSPLEADALEYHDTRNIFKYMATGDFASALSVVEASNDAKGVVKQFSRTPGSTQESALSSGILVLFVTSKDTESFPLAALLNAEMTAADELVGLDAQAADARAREAQTEAKDIFIAAGKELADILSIAEVTILQAPEDWFSGPACVNKLMRINSFYKWVRVSAKQHAGGDPRLLLGIISTQSFLETGFMQVVAYLSQGQAPIATFNWHLTRDESFEGGLSNLSEAMRDSRMSPLRSAPQEVEAYEAEDEGTATGLGLEIDELSFSAPAKPGTLLH